MKKFWRIFLMAFLLVGLITACDDETYEEPLDEEESSFFEEDAENEPDTFEEDEEANADEPERVVEEDIYTHSSGRFSLVPFSDEFEEDEYGVYFYDNDTSFYVMFFENVDELTKSTADDQAGLFLELLVDEFDLTQFAGVVDEYSFEAEFDYSFEDENGDTFEGQGTILLTQDADFNTYALILFSDNAGQKWSAAVDSFFTYTFEMDVAENSGGNSSSSSNSNSSSSSSSSAAAGGTDSGFRPTTDGFSFENYGNEGSVVNLTAAEMERMFGPAVCANKKNGQCTLTPPAKQWMKQMNEYMDGGHCEGMAVLSTLFFYDQQNPADFGNSTPYKLKFNGNEKLQREIAYWFVTQGTYPGGEEKVNSSPAAVVKQLQETFAQGDNAQEWWVMGIYQEDFSGGHAITPYAVKDMGNGVYHVLVYDNNWPGDERYVKVNTKNNTWEYEAAINPDEDSELYKGDEDTETLEIVSVSPRLVTQDCEFCSGKGATTGRPAGVAAFQTDSGFNEIWLVGPTNLLIEDENGNRLGYDGTQFVNEIPGAEGRNMRFLQTSVWDVDNEPVYRVPVGVKFTITVDASLLTEPSTSSVAMIGPGYNLVVQDIYLDPGTKDTITVSPDGSQLSYKTEYNDAPDMIFGVETEEADYEFIVAALDIEAGAEFFVNLDLENGSLNINTTGTKEYGIYEIVMYRVDDEDEQWFNNNDIYLEPNDTAYLLFSEWEGPGSSMFIDIDYSSDGSVDETIELIDELTEE